MQRHKTYRRIMNYCLFFLIIGGFVVHFLVLLGINSRLGYGQEAKAQSTKPIFTFVQITDTHIGSYGDYQAGMQYFVDKIRNEVDFLLPDFILVTGDLADGGTEEQYQQFKHFMDSVGIPYYPISLQEDDIFHIGTQAIATLPHSYRHYSVYPDRIEVNTYYLQMTAGDLF